MKLKLIVAVSEGGVIGLNNTLPWGHIKEDMQHFKKTTSNCNVIMGRKTYESIDMALPKRTNIVITRDKSFVANNVIVANSIDEALLKIDVTKDTFIIGGYSIYEQVLERDIVEEIVLTKFLKKFHGDTFFKFENHLFNMVDTNISVVTNNEGDTFPMTQELYIRNRDITQG